MLETAQNWLGANWEYLTAYALSFSIGIAVVGRTIKGVGDILGAKTDKNAKELQVVMMDEIFVIKEDVQEMKDKMYLDAKINSTNPVLTTSERAAYAEIGTKSVLDKIEDGLDILEKVIDIGTTVKKTWLDV